MRLVPHPSFMHIKRWCAKIRSSPQPPQLTKLWVAVFVRLEWRQHDHAYIFLFLPDCVLDGLHSRRCIDGVHGVEPGSLETRLEHTHTTSPPSPS